MIKNINLYDEMRTKTDQFLLVDIRPFINFNFKKKIIDLIMYIINRIINTILKPSKFRTHILIYFQNFNKPEVGL